MWKKQKVSVVFSTYNEKDSIKKSIEEFFNTDYVDEIIVVNNNAVKGTSEEIAKTKAIEIFEKRQGYGWGYRRGLNEATGDLIIMSEPDGTFFGKDILKLLAYSDDFDVVFGTRTRDVLILENANMGTFLRHGNWALAKFVEVFFNTTSLSDCGCTMRLIRRNALKKIQPFFMQGSSSFGFEMMLLTILKKIKFIEIPVHYGKRIGKSSVTGSFVKAFKLGMQMFFLSIKYKFKYF
ncbi:MAG: glycosyltransferase family 2 protein [Candidatus Nanoarchaeia archaeon]|nr:glycosyltransferase family 2 protein [Candidatus Nanoarchaeia archaeon]MDD5741451.1 glycosyltransferase family 2 protein [Candidatus Nanoarchaeia archaeon]